MRKDHRYTPSDFFLEGRVLLSDSSGMSGQQVENGTLVTDANRQLYRDWSTMTGGAPTSPVLITAYEAIQDMVRRGEITPVDYPMGPAPTESVGQRLFDWMAESYQRISGQSGPIVYTSDNPSYLQQMLDLLVEATSANRPVVYPTP